MFYDFNLNHPVNIHFGKGALDYLADEVKVTGDKVMLVYGAVIAFMQISLNYFTGDSSVSHTVKHSRSSSLTGSRQRLRLRAQRELSNFMKVSDCRWTKS